MASAVLWRIPNHVTCIYLFHRLLDAPPFSFSKLFSIPSAPLNGHGSPSQKPQCCVVRCSRRRVLDQAQLALYIPSHLDADPAAPPPLRLPRDPTNPNPSSATPSSLSHWMPISSLHLEHHHRRHRLSPRRAATLQTPRPDDSRLMHGDSPHRC
jgi:hypothetical protein